jgi:hypothetical protein
MVLQMPIPGPLPVFYNKIEIAIRGFIAIAAGHTVLRPAQQHPPMPTPSHQRSRKRVPKPDRRRALELLASSPDGCTEGLMVANGFTIELLLELVRTGLASAHAERKIVDGKMTEVARLGITDEGRRLLRSHVVTT